MSAQDRGVTRRAPTGIRDYQKTIAETLDDRLLRWQGVKATEELGKSPNSKVVVIGSGEEPTLLRRACLPGLALGATAAIAALPRVGRALTVPAISGRPPIALGLVWGGDAEGWLAEGVEFARDEINRDGGVLGSQIELVRRTIDPTMPDPRAAAVEVARGLCQRGDVLAVIGHSRAEEAIPAAITYDQNGLIFLNPRVTRRALNDCGFLRTFTSVPTDSMIAQQIATFAFGLGYRRFMVLRSREDFAEDLTIAFAYQVSRLGMTIVDEHSFTPSHTNFKDIVADLGAPQFDAILIAAQPNQTVALIRQSHGVHLDVPFLIGRFVPVPAILAEIGKSTTPVAVPVLFNPDSSFPPAVRFRQGFKTRYGAEPDEWAAQGYDAVRLLAAAIKAGDKADAGSVATVMRYALSWKGVTGRYSFDRAGRIYTKQLKFATIDQDGVRYHDVDE